MKLKKEEISKENEPVWKSISLYFKDFDINFTKVNKQIDIFREWVTNGAVGFVEAATGFGKTLIAIIAIIRFNLKNPNGKIIVVVPNTNLHKDWTSQKGYINTFYLKNVFVYIVNTYTMSNINRECDLLILDEVHRYCKEESTYFSQVLSLTKYKYLLCLSATLGKEEKKFLEQFNIKRVGYVSLEEAERNGWVSQFVIFNYGVNLNSDDDETAKKIKHLHDSYFKKFDYDYELATACRMPDKSYYRHKKQNITLTCKEWREKVGNKYGISEKEVRKNAGLWFNYMQARKTFIHKSEDKIKAVIDILEYHKKKTIVFSEFTEICDALQNHFKTQANSYHSNISSIIYTDKTLKKPIAYSIKVNDKIRYKYYNQSPNQTFTYNEIKASYKSVVKLSGDKLKTKIKEDFRNNLFKYLFTAKALDEGYDDDSIEMGIIHSGTSVSRVGIQRIGRVLRYVPGKTAIIINVYVKDTQDEKWLESRLKGISQSKIHWVDHPSQIRIPELEEDVVLT